MFQFPGCPSWSYGFASRCPGITLDGFPHSDICGSLLTCSSPQLFAAGRVLLRRMVPWHPPCALCSLIFSSLILRPIVVTLFSMFLWIDLIFLSFILFPLGRKMKRIWSFPTQFPILRIATGLSKSFSVQLSRCRWKFNSVSFSTLKSLSYWLYSHSEFVINPENDTELKRFSKQLS